MELKTVFFSIGEEEIIESLQEIYNITRLEACDQVIMQKRELAYQHQMRGNLELAKSLLLELGEWNDEREEDFQKVQSSTNKKIILLP
jgi:hypothetical protein